jgi:hypothetical protein
MSYVGVVRPTETSSQVFTDTFTGTGVETIFTLSNAPISEQHLFVTINGVMQHGSAYSVVDTTLTFSEAPADGDAIEARIISNVGVGYLPPDNSIQSKHLAPQSISRDKLTNYNFNTVRQTVLSGRVDSDGYANFIETSGSLSCDLKASTDPVIVSFSSGFDELGSLDYISKIDIDQNGCWTGLPASNVSYLYAERNATTGVVSYGHSLVPTQYSHAFDKTKQSLLHFDGVDASTTIVDEYGNTWSVGGNAQIDTAQSKFGASSLLLDGTGDYATSSSFTSLNTEGWTLEGQVRFNVLPASTAAMDLVDALNASYFGARLQVYNNAGTYQLRYYLSSSGTSADIAAATAGTITVTTGVWYHWAITYDPVAGAYKAYWNGTQILNTASTSKIASITGIWLGIHPNTFSQPLNGWIDEFRFSPCCRYPAGSTFTPSVSAFTTDAQWFSLANFKYYVGDPVSGWTQKQRVLIGEATTGTTNVSSTITYALRGEYHGVQETIAAATGYIFSHNIGVNDTTPTIRLECKTADVLYVPGEIAHTFSDGNAGTGSGWYGAALRVYGRNVLRMSMGTSGVGVISASANVSPFTAGSWRAKVFVKRNW